MMYPPGNMQPLEAAGVLTPMTSERIAECERLIQETARLANRPRRTIAFSPVMQATTTAPAPQKAAALSKAELQQAALLTLNELQRSLPNMSRAEVWDIAENSGPAKLFRDTYGYSPLPDVNAPPPPPPTEAVAKQWATTEWDTDPSVRAGFTSKENYIYGRAAELTGRSQFTSRIPVAASASAPLPANCTTNADGIVFEKRGSTTSIHMNREAYNRAHGLD